MSVLAPTHLAAVIREVFMESDKYQLDKYVPAFTVNGAFLGDFFSYTMLEPRGDQPPVFYHVFSPYDVISNKAPLQAVVFDAGDMVLDIDFTEYTAQRTGVMSPLVAQAIGQTTMAGKRILFVGTGKTGTYAMIALKALFPDVANVEFVNAGSLAESFTAAAQAAGIHAERGSLTDIGAYDYIFCHSSSKQPVLTADMRGSIKKGALITSYATEDHAEVSEEFFDTADANVLIDWDKTLSEAKELARAVESGRADPAKALRLRDVFSGSARPDASKAYSVYRSCGTPMQNLAVLKHVMANA